MNTNADNVPKVVMTRGFNRYESLSRKLLPALIASCFVCSPAWSNPTGAQVVAGQASITNNGNVLTVTNTPGSIINWQSFSINPGELTQFLQQSSSSTVLNRIVGQNPTQIFGALQSNGKVYLINPNGILFGVNSQVNVGGLVASSLDISNADFQTGKLNFSGTQAGAVSNQGNIVTPSGGQVYLIAPQVQNNGIITSPQGEVLLAAGHSVQLVDGGDPNIQVVISAPTDQALNLGSVVAQGGKIGIYGALVNQSGIVSANSAVVGQNGQIVFKASDTTTLAGNSQTTATGVGTGGNVYLLGNQVGLTDNALVDASGQTGGGTVLVGGAYHGGNPAIQNATATYVGADTVIKADAVQTGNGGQVIIWSENATRAYGGISAQGGAFGGNGGFVETSGHYLDVSGINVRANANTVNGKPGTWLLDPYDITIGTGSDTSTNSGTNPITYKGSTSGSLLLASTVVTALNGGTSVIVDTSGAGSDTGSITVSSPILVAPSGNPTLTLKANQDININADIASSGDPLAVVLTADQLSGGTGVVNINATIITNNGNLTINGGNAVNIGASTPGYLDTGNTIGSAGGAPLTINLPNSSATINVHQNASTDYSNSQSLMLNGSSITLNASTLNLNGNISTGGAMALTAGAGGITNSGGSGLLTASTLQLTSSGSVTIAGNNNFSTFAANMTGSNPLSMEDAASGVTIGTVGGTTGVTAPGGFTLREYTNGGITVSNNITASSGDILLGIGSGAGGITISSGASVSGHNVQAYTDGGSIAVSGAMSAGSVYSMSLDSGGAGTITTSGSGLLTADAFYLQNGVGTGAIGSSGTPLATSSVGGGTNVATMAIGNTSPPSGPSAVYINHTGALDLSSVTLGANAPVSVAATNSVTVPSINTGTANLAIGSGNVLTIPMSVTLSGGGITLTADQMAITTSPNPAAISAGSGLVWLQPYTSGSSILLGPMTGSGLVLSTDVLDTITAGTLRIGSATAGPISIGAAIAPSSVTTLSLSSGGAITQTSGSTITAPNLATTSLGSTILDTATNEVTNLAATVGNSTQPAVYFTFQNGQALNVASSIDSLSGIAVHSSASGFTAGSNNGIVALTTTAGAITQSAGATIGGFAVAANGYAGVTLQQANPAGVIAGSTTGGDFDYTSANGINVNTIYGTAGITVGGSHNIVLVANTTGGIGQANTSYLAASGGELALQTNGAVNLNAANNNVSFLTADLTGTGALVFTNSANLTVNDPSTLASPLSFSGGIVTTNADVQLKSGTGNTITLSQAINAGSGNVFINGDGGVTQTAAITAQGLAVQSSSAVSLSTSNSVSNFAAATGGSLTFVGSGSLNDTTVTGSAQLGSPSLAGITSAGSVLLVSPSGSVTLTSPLNAGSSHLVTISAPTGAISGSGLITGSALVATAASGIGSSSPLNTQVATLTLTNTGVSGNIDIVNNQGASGPLLLENIKQTLPSGGGDISITNYGALTVDTTATISTALGTGNISLVAHSPLTVNGTVAANTTSGTVTLEAGATGSAADILTVSATGVVNSFAATLDAGAGIMLLGSVTGTLTKNDNQNASLVTTPTLSQCTTTPTLAGCSAVLPSISLCTTTPTLAGCSAVLPTIAACTSAPTTAGCSAVLPTITTCTSAPTTAGCSAVLPTIAVCTTAPTTAGCSSVLPTVDVCTSAPTTAGCSAVLPTIATCTSAPTTAGCSAVLPTVATCTNTPTLAGCAAVLPTVSTCTTSPTLAGCSAVLPTIATCTATPTLAGCSVILPTIATCTATPTLAGCSAILPTIATCTATPTLAGCSAVLPTIATCTATPTQAGCSAVLPTIAACTATPTLAGCSAVLPTLASCTATPTLAGCSTVLPTIASCTATPTLAGCSAVLPTLASCTATPTLAGCSAVLPTLATCTTTPTLAGCSAVLPTIAACTATPTLAGCSAVLPTLATCTAAPTLAGCDAVLPTIEACVATPSLPGCATVDPTVTQTQDTSPINQATSTTINAINSSSVAIVALASTTPTQNTGTTSAGNSDNTDSGNNGNGTGSGNNGGNGKTSNQGNSGATNPPPSNTTNVKKLYCN